MPLVHKHNPLNALQCSIYAAQVSDAEASIINALSLNF